MAELNDRVEKFAAATLTLTLSQTLRLSRNFRYYRQQESESVYRSDLLQQADRIKTLGFVLQNLICGKDFVEYIPFFVSTAGQIHDLFEELHRLLLFFEAEKIEPLIPIVDEERKFWKERHQTDFYDKDLVIRLEHDFPKNMKWLRKKIDELPESTTL